MYPTFARITKDKYLWFARWQGLEVNMHVDDDVVFWGWNTTANQPPRLSTDGKKSSKNLGFKLRQLM